jgi:hypothetical protein
MTEIIHPLLQVKMRTLGWLLLVVFVKRDNLRDIGNVESERTRTGFGGLTVRFLDSA